MEQSKPKRIVKAYLLSIGLWSALSLLIGWQYRIFDQLANLKSTLGQMILLAEARGLAFALLTPPVFYIVRHYAPGARKRLRYLFVYCAGVVPYMLSYACIRWIILPSWSPASQRFVSRASMTPFDLIYEAFGDIITIYIATLLAAHAYEYFERARKQELERAEYQQALAASELQALKMQIHPHFLFNTLHGISTLIDTDRESAKAMIVKLSSLLRISLQDGSSDLIPLQQELKFVEEYLDLEKMRFGTRLAIRWSIDQSTWRILVPQLILQPLVENAIRHGIACSRDMSWVEIVAQQTNARLELHVSNNIGVKKALGTGVGLRNTRARLKCLYSGEAMFSFVIDEDRTAIAMIVLPALGAHLQSGKDAALTSRTESEASNRAHIDCG